MTTLILFYVFLFLFTFIIFRNSYIMWKLNRDFTFGIATLIIFYFSLLGAFIFPLDSYLGFTGKTLGLHYLPIFDRLFPVAFDSDYLLACGYYMLFILVFQYTYIIYVKRYVRIHKIDFNNVKTEPYEIIINPYIVMAISFSLVFIGAFIMRKEIYFAIAHERSIYTTTRFNQNSLYTIHQLANEMSVLLPFMAYSFTMIKSNRFNIRIDKKKGSMAIIFITCFIASLYVTFLGNRREILSGLVFCTLISLNQIKNLNFKRYGFMFLFVLAFFLSNDFFRSRYIPHALNSVFHLEANGEVIERVEQSFDAKSNIASVLFSNEMFYAHFSMYGVLHKDVPLTYGSSFVSLAVSFIPRAIYPDRMKDISYYYYDAVHAKSGQFYTLHHATAYYLNFGLPGIFIGGFILASFFIFAFFINFYSFKRKSIFWDLLKYLIPFLICGQLVTFITGGPEAYKSMILEGILIPVLLLWVCCKKTTLEENSTRLI